VHIHSAVRLVNRTSTLNVIERAPASSNILGYNGDLFTTFSESVSFRTDKPTYKGFIDGLLQVPQVRQACGRLYTWLNRIEYHFPGNFSLCLIPVDFPESVLTMLIAQADIRGSCIELSRVLPRIRWDGNTQKLSLRAVLRNLDNFAMMPSC
jgi:hypothetical protein